MFLPFLRHFFLMPPDDILRYFARSARRRRSAMPPRAYGAVQCAMRVCYAQLAVADAAYAFAR